MLAVLRASISCFAIACAGISCAHDAHPAVPAYADVGTITGRVQAASDDSIVIRRDGARDLTLQIDAKTATTQDGAEIAARDLTPGAQVTVSYRLVGDQPIADIVQATRSIEPGTPGSLQRTSALPSSMPGGMTSPGQRPM
nr:hypothetical protein [Kofleriaceae bacterium]